MLIAVCASKTYDSVLSHKRKKPRASLPGLDGLASLAKFIQHCNMLASQLSINYWIKIHCFKKQVKKLK